MDYVRQVKEKEEGDLDKSRDQMIESFKRKLFDLLDEGESPNKAVRRLEHRLKKIKVLYSQSKVHARDESEDSVSDLGMLIFQLAPLQLFFTIPNFFNPNLQNSNIQISLYFNFFGRP